MNRDPASFRDPSGHVFHQDGPVLRTITARAAPHYEHVRDAGLLRRSIERGGMVETREAPDRGDFDGQAAGHKAPPYRRREPLARASHAGMLHQLRSWIAKCQPAGLNGFKTSRGWPRTGRPARRAGAEGADRRGPRRAFLARWGGRGWGCPRTGPARRVLKPLASEGSP